MNESISITSIIVSITITLLGAAILGLFAFVLRINSAVAVLEKQVALFWKAIEADVVTILHRPTHFDVDTLLEKFQAETITLKEIEKLKQELEFIIDNEKDKAMAAAAKKFLILIQAKYSM